MTAFAGRTARQVRSCRGIEIVGSCRSSVDVRPMNATRMLGATPDEACELGCVTQDERGLGAVSARRG